MKTSLMLFLIAFIVGCANSTSRSTILINSRASIDASGKTKFVILPGPNISNRLEFEDVSNALSSALIAQGYVFATAADAELAISLDYSTSTDTQSYTTSSPVYGSVPGPVSTIHAVTVPIGSSKGPTMTTGHIINQPITAVVGQETQVRNVIFSGVRALIEASDAQAIRDTINKNTPYSGKVLWRIDATYVVRGYTDQGKVAPVLVTAAAPYAGKNTGGVITIKR